MQSRKELRDLKRTLTKVRKSEEKIKNLSDEELSALTEQFKSRYSDGESLESLMPEAFAAICEADYRVLGKRPYDVQIIAAAALHGGYLAEMNTGEGKTLSATMPLYLNALTGKSCMLVTTNEYLASRDGAEMGEVLAAHTRMRMIQKSRMMTRKDSFIRLISYTLQMVHLALISFLTIW